MGWGGEKRSRVTHPRYWNITEKRATGMYLGEIELYVHVIYSQVEFEFFLVYIILFKSNNRREEYRFIFDKYDRIETMIES